MSDYNVNIFASFPTIAIVDPQQALSQYGNSIHYLNTIPANQTCTISAHNTNPNTITSAIITSNGITDGNFNIYPIKYTGEQINFVVQLQDLNGVLVKDYPLLTSSEVNLSLSSNNGNYIDGVSFYSNFGTLSSLTQGGFFKGYLVSPVSATSVCIKAVVSTGLLDITGSSSTFNIYNSGGVYDIRKINENFDQTAAYLSLATQPALYDKPQLFNNFLGQIVGNVNSDPNTLGIETYEKISNFVSNNEDVEYCNINQLKSLLQSINATYQDFNYQYPPSLRRVADILSVKHKRLFGQINQYQGNFDKKGYVNSPTYGLNLGNELRFETTILTAGSGIYPSNIVAYEMFGQIYSVLNTNLISLSTPSENPYQTITFDMSTYPLSSYLSSWGWDLVLPIDQGPVDITQYYKFYEFIPGIEGSLLQKFIDFDNPNNTLAITNSSYSAFTEKGGIMDNILLYNLYTGLEILS